MICEHCKNSHDGSYGSGRFCSSSCARSFSTSKNREIINKKISNTLKRNRCVKGGLIKLCDFGCGREAKHKFKNNKWCCETSANKCPTLKKKNSNELIKIHKQNKGRIFTREDGLKGIKSRKKTLQEQYDKLPFDEKPLAERIRIILHEQNYRCAICNIKDWCDQPLTLHLDHIDGNNDNEKRENLRYTCPNCHSQTRTYCGKNIRNKPINEKKIKKALETSDNIHQALKKCGLVPKGANYIRAKKLLKNSRPSGETR